MIDLSIIIISYNTAQITKKCLETIYRSLLKSKLNVEIILFDNNSTDESKEDVTSYELLVTSNKQIKLKTIWNKENLGFAKGNNEAVKHAKGKYLLFLNSDIEVIDDAIDNLYQYYISQKDFQFVGAKLLNPDLSPQPSVGPFYSLPYVFIWLFLRGDYWGGSRNSPNTLTKADWVSGACFINQKKCFDQLKGFDENIFMYMDEVDLFYRAKKKGLNVGFYPDAKFIHLGSASSASRKQPILQVYSGLLYFYKKHFSTLELNILKFLLKLKAKIALGIGRISNNQYLISTYEQALQIAK